MPLAEDLKPCTVCGEPVLWGTRHAHCGARVMEDARRGLDASHLIDELEYAVLARSQGLPGSVERLSAAKLAIRAALANLKALDVSASEQEQYGNCDYWCPACFDAISKPEHRAASPVASETQGDAK